VDEPRYVLLAGLSPGLKSSWFSRVTGFFLSPRIPSTNACRPRPCGGEFDFGIGPDCVRISLCALSSPDVHRLDPIPRLQVISPREHSKCHGGVPCLVSWLDDGQAPLVTAMGPCSVALFAGNEARRFFFSRQCFRTHSCTDGDPTDRTTRRLDRTFIHVHRERLS
jgi:hypothetical protein